MSHPEGSIRGRDGYDRVIYPDGFVDLQAGQGCILAAAIEDSIYRGIWCTGVTGARVFVVLSKVESLMEWRPESMAIADADDALYAEQERANELLNGDR